MGCCFSRPGGPNAPYPGGAPSPSARAINSPPPPVRQSSTTEDSSIGGAVDSATATASASAAAAPVVAIASLSPNHHHQQFHRQDEDARSRSHRRHSSYQRNHSHNYSQLERSSSQQQQQPQQIQPPLSQHIDKPLRRHRWTAKKRPWTRTALDTERADFFDTRVTGRQEIWLVLRAALEVLWEADLSSRRNNHDEHKNNNNRNNSEDDGDSVDSRHGEEGREQEEDESLATAQSILRAAEVTLPTGDLVDGAYDALGSYYALPEWIVSDPVNVAEDSGVRSAVAAHQKPTGGGGDDDEDEDGDTDEEAALRRREEKGKAVANVRNMVKVCARLSENGRDVIVRAGAEESVRSIVRRVVEDSELPPSKRIRLAYMGKILKENASLQAQGWQKGHVVNALVFSQ